MKYEYNDVALSVVKNLRIRVLNASFVKLYDNDTDNLPANNYAPAVWERKWFNDGNVNGYKLGQCVWTHALMSSDFIDLYADTVYEYARNSRRGTMRNTLTVRYCDIPSLKNEVLRQKMRDNYQNAISGWSEYEVDEISGTVTRTQIYPSMFVYCPREKPKTDPSERIQIFMSTKDNNKDELSVTSSWKPAVISSYSQLTAFISSEFDQLFDTHVKDYHFGGLSSLSAYDEVLMRKDLRNFDINEVYNVNELKSYEQNVDQEGFDYVIRFAKQENILSVDDKRYRTYRMFRLWKSGYLEHFGLVPVEICSFISSTNPLDYTQKINLNWTYDINGTHGVAPVYSYPSGGGVDDIYNRYYYTTNISGDITETISVGQFLSPKCRYSVSIVPVVFDLDKDIVDGKIVDYSVLKDRSYPENTILSSKNDTYFNLETHHIRNDSFYVTKSNVWDLRMAERIQFYSYRVTGYTLSA